MIIIIASFLLFITSFLIGSIELLTIGTYVYASSLIPLFITPFFDENGT